MRTFWNGASRFGLNLWIVSQLLLLLTIFVLSLCSLASLAGLLGTFEFTRQKFSRLTAHRLTKARRLPQDSARQTRRIGFLTSTPTYSRPASGEKFVSRVYPPESYLAVLTDTGKMELQSPTLIFLISGAFSTYGTSMIVIRGKGRPTMFQSVMLEITITLS